MKHSFQNKYAISIGLSLFAFLIITVLGLVFPQFFQEWEEKTLDYRFRLREDSEVSPYITHIGIDDISLDEIGGWPWDRSIHARMIDLLGLLGTSVIGLDIIFPRASSPESDRDLILAVQRNCRTILAAPFQLVDHPCFTPQEYQKFLERYPAIHPILSPFEQIDEQSGHTCIDFDSLSDEQAEQLGDEAYLELVMHDPFVYTGENDRQRVEKMLQRFQYPFTLQKPGMLWYANRAAAPMQGLSQAAQGLGHISATPDSDGVFRRIPLVVEVQGQFIPSLSLAAVLAYLDVSPEHVVMVPGEFIELREARYPKAQSRVNIRIPVDDRLQIRVNYPSQYTSHSFSDILAVENNSALMEAREADFRDRICTIGYISTGTGDIGPTPIETNYPLAFIHSAVMNTILTQRFLHETSWGSNVAITLLLLFFISMIFPRLSPLRFTLAMLSSTLGYIVFTTVLFNWTGIILKLVQPVLSSLLLAYALIIVYWYATEERERKHLRSAFKTYVSKQMLGQILENPKSLALTGQRKEITIMFSDVRQFSTLSDKIEPEAIHRLLNMYFSQMTRIAFEYDGFVDKFIGDGLLCFFGDPIAHPDHALRAVRAAIDMQQAVREIGPEIQKELGLDPIVIRIGINTGYVIVGNMGSADRMEYTVLGSEVNLAQRLESSATPGQVLISQNTYDHICQEIETLDKGEIKVKGFDRPIKVYEIELPFE
ncbi:hypothetical protein CSA56_08775 [candidate division KSB3 bacterium]|uniref:Guanylate cyclase domain-containing protein n=1 Tax=candidate division KSB3 bacterium TaxID=2044937 RepID=A0A2G6KEZ8_9BACT|nr:MAG: hypothetical protein CSA56_08775 [candidate division KSB3 bacterium]